MNISALQMQVPGKLLIAGEFAVLEPDHHCIVAAIDRYVYAEIAVRMHYSLHLPDIGFDQVTFTELNGELFFDTEAKKLLFIQNALRVCVRYLRQTDCNVMPFSLSVTSELDDATGKKYGLGSSAAVVVSVVASVLKLHGKDDKELIFKLSAIAHFLTQGNGSCADIAASTYGGYLRYSAFHADFLTSHLQKATEILELIEMDWPGLSVEPVKPPADLSFSVGWSGSAMATSRMIDKVEELKKNRPEFYRSFTADSERAVNRLKEAFRQQDAAGAIASMADNRKALQRLSEAVALEIETPLLKELIRIADRYGAGKTSGAGGGDCGIAFTEGDIRSAQMKEDWRAAGIEPLNVSVSFTGAEVTGKAESSNE